MCGAAVDDFCCVGGPRCSALEYLMKIRRPSSWTESNLQNVFLFEKHAAEKEQEKSELEKKKTQ